MDSMELRQKLDECGQAMNALVEASEKEDRDFSSEEESRWNEYRANYESLEKRLERAQILERGQHVYENDEQREADDREHFERKRKSKSDLEGSRITRDDYQKGLNFWIMGPGYADAEQAAMATRCGFNMAADAITLRGELMPGGSKEVRDREMLLREMRDQTTATANLGGDWMPTDMIAAVSKTMAAFGGMRDAARIINTASGNPFDYPTVDDTGNSGAILAEGSADAVTDVTVGNVAFESYHVTSDIVKVSIQALADVVVSWDTVLGDLLGERVARGENTLLTTGTGTAQHNGILNVTSSAVTSTAPLASTGYTWANMLTVVHAVDPMYRMNPSTRWMMNDTTLRRVREISDSQNRPLWNADLSAGAPGTFAGHPITINQAMSSGTSDEAIVFGDFNQYVVRSVNGITLRRTTERYFEEFEVGFVASIRSDGDALQSGAFASLTNAAT